MKWTLAPALGFSVLAACSAAPPSGDPAARIAGPLSSSVQLFAEREGGARRAGSGIVVARDPDGRATIVTAAHLVEPQVEQNVTVKASRRGDPAPAAIIAVDPEIDIAVLQVDGLSATPARFGAGGRLGDEVWVISFPWGRHGTLVTGVVSQVMDGESDALLPYRGPVTLVDAAVSYGSSGGGVFDARSGALIAIVRGYRTAKLALPGPESQPLEFPLAGETTVVPVEQILCLLKAAQRAGTVPVVPSLAGRADGFCEAR